MVVLLANSLRSLQTIFSRPSMLSGSKLPTTSESETLRRKVVSQASELISTVHACASSPHDFIPPIIASSRAFIAGCSIATGISKKWTLAQSHAKDLIKCTEILALFAPHWKGGDDYLSVWRTIINVLELE